MYRIEVPLYGTLLKIVHDSDMSVMSAAGRNIIELPGRHDLERHGAVRLGTADELRSIKRPSI